MALTKSEKIVKDSLNRHQALGDIALWFRPVHLRFSSIQMSLPFDFWYLSNKGKFVSLEVKEVAGWTLPFQNIKENQWEIAREISSADGIACAVIFLKEGKRNSDDWAVFIVDFGWLEEVRSKKSSVNFYDLVKSPYSCRVMVTKDYGLTEGGKTSWGIDLTGARDIAKRKQKRIALRGFRGVLLRV